MPTNNPDSDGPVSEAQHAYHKRVVQALKKRAVYDSFLALEVLDPAFMQASYNYQSVGFERKESPRVIAIHLMEAAVKHLRVGSRSAVAHLVETGRQLRARPTPTASQIALRDLIEESLDNTR